MIQVQTLERARAGARRIEKDTFIGNVVDLIVGNEESEVVPRPQSFLVEQAPNWSLRVHFHLRHQFQLFVDGGGWLGRSLIEPLTVHYASPHSGYGPLISDERGISYLTMRAISDSGAWYLPESRDQLKTGIRKEQAHGHPRHQVTARELRSLSAMTQETLIPMTAGGLAAWIVRMPPATKAAAPSGAKCGGGRFFVVTQGTLHAPPGEQRGLATLFVPRDDTLDLEAGSDGAEVVVMQFPQEALLPVAEDL